MQLLTLWLAAAWFAPGALAQMPESATRLDLQRATTRIKAALVRRDRAEAEVRARPGFGCAALSATCDEVDEAWAELAEVWRRAPAQRERHGGALSTIAAERAADQRHAQALRAWCGGLPQVAPIAAPAAVEPALVAPGLWAHGAVLEATVSPGWPKRAADLRDLLARVGESIADDWDVALVLVEGGIAPERSLRWSIAIDRGVPGLGARPPWSPAHLPDWRRLAGAALLDGRRGLAGAATLRALVAVYGNRLARPGCPPAAAGGWGVSDVGGQLGGGRPGSLVPLGDGRWAVEPLYGSRLNRVANGGNRVPYAPVELYLMGFVEPGEVPLRQQLRSPVERAGALAAAGTCRLDGRSLVADFGRRPRRARPLSVGVIVATARRLGSARVRAHRRAAAAFFAAGPDDDPFSLNFFEASGGRARAQLSPPRLRGAQARPTVAP